MHNRMLGSGRVRTVLGMSDKEYHGFDSLSSTGARTLLEVPAKYKYQMDNPRPYKPQFEVGHAAHTMILGEGGDIRVIDAKDWRSKAAREERDYHLLKGRTPLLTHEHRQVVAMYDAVMANQTARRLFEHAGGVPELSFFWDDVEHGVPLRARTDWLIQGETIVDLKTTVAAGVSDWEKAIGTYWYHLQAAWYSEAVFQAYDFVPNFYWVVVEKTPPYLTAVYSIEPDALRAGFFQANKAVERYAECLSWDFWPGYPPQIQPVGLPGWLMRQQKQ